jgi:hypothetical protein
LLTQPPASEQLLARLLPAGQELAARVQQSRPEGTAVRLQLLIAGQLVELNVQRALPPGTGVLLSRTADGQLQLTLNAQTTQPPGTGVLLSRTADGQLQLRLSTPAQTTPAPASAAPQGSSGTSLDSILRLSLPRQQNFSQVLNRLSQNAAQTTPASSAGARQIAQLVQSLLQMFSVTPGAADASAAIRRTLEKGGFFTEARLARGRDPSRPAATGPDLKARLAQLRQLSDALPPQAREQLQTLLDDLLARITTRQLSSAAQGRDLPEGASERHLAMDVPVQAGERLENVDVRLKRYRGGRTACPGENLWLIRLQFELQALGSLEAELRLRDDASLSARFWASEPATARLIDARLPDFAASLNRQGIRVDNLNCRHGAAPAGGSGIRQPLIDLKT